MASTGSRNALSDREWGGTLRECVVLRHVNDKRFRKLQPVPISCLTLKHCLGLGISICKAELGSQTMTEILVLLPSKLFPFIHLFLHLFLHLFIKYLHCTYHGLGTPQTALIIKQIFSLFLQSL